MQASLFDPEPLGFDPRFSRARRVDLGQGAWVEHVPGLVSGHEHLFHALWHGVHWRTDRRVMYDRVVDVPRLLARFPEDAAPPPLLLELGAALSARHGKALVRVSAACYRDGRDSVAWHGDRVGALRHDTVVAVLGLGHPRRFLLRPRGGGRSLAFPVGCGDLLVMGGTCQATWEHAVPKVARAGPRISVMFREVVPEPR